MILLHRKNINFQNNKILNFFFHFLGYGWLIIEVQSILTPHGIFTVNLKHPIVRIFIESQGTNAVYTSKEMASKDLQWIKINEVFRSKRIEKNTRITIDIKQGDNIIYIMFIHKN